VKDSNKLAYNWERHSRDIKALLTKSSYNKWFDSSNHMITGSLYETKILDSLLADARERATRFVPILMRIVSQELACRWVYKEL